MYCGNALSDATVVDARPGGRTCPSCGRFDELNLKFCVLCGGRLKTDTLIETPPDLSRPSVSGERLPRERQRPVPNDAVSAKMRAIAQPEKRTTRESRLLHWFVGGIVGGGVTAGALFFTGIGDQLAVMTLPRKGLAIYTQKPYVKVTLQDMAGKSFSLGSTSANGSLVIDDLPVGPEYRLKMSAEGCETVYFPAFKLDRERATILGFPKKIVLPARN